MSQQYAVTVTFKPALSEEQVFLLSNALDGLAEGNVAWREGDQENGPWVLQFYCMSLPDKHLVEERLSDHAAIHGLDLAGMRESLDIAEIPETDWLQKVYEELKPFSIGPFFIYGSHFDGEPPAGSTPLLIEAAAAFGSGTHETTKGCVMAMLDLKVKGICPWNILDMGAGSGILSLIAWHLWESPVLGVDNNPDSVPVAIRHRDTNNIPAPSAHNPGVHFELGDGFHTQMVQDKAPYELVIANILAGPVKDMAPDLHKVCDKNGVVILSGMLNEQADDVLSVYTKLGFKELKRYVLEEWSTLVLRLTQL